MAKETRRIQAHDMVRVVSTSREIARAPQFQPERRAYAPVMRGNVRGAQSEIVAYRGRGESRDVITSTREKGAHKKVREAE